MFEKKRQLDLNEKVIALRRAEVDLQEVLAKIAQKIAESVSSDVFVDTGLPLAPHKPPHKKDMAIILRKDKRKCLKRKKD